MKKLWVRMILAVSLSLAYSQGASAAGIFEKLTPRQKSDIQNGRTVFITEEVADSDWPNAYFFKRVDVTPEEAMAVIWDFDLQKTYAPNILRSEISAHVDRTTVQVDYTLNFDLPLIGWPFYKENYTVENHLSTYDSGDSYRFDCKKVRSDHMEVIEGNARFEHLGTGAIMAYYSRLIPSLRYNILIRDFGLRQFKDLSTSLATQMNKEKTELPDLLKAQVEELRKALKP